MMKPNPISLPRSQQIELSFAFRAGLQIRHCQQEGVPFETDRRIDPTAERKVGLTTNDNRSSRQNIGGHGWTCTALTVLFG